MSGTPKRAIQRKTNARVQSTAEIEERGGASIHFASAINKGKNIIAILTIWQGAHQNDGEVREPPLGDGDVQRLGPGLVVNSALLAVQAGLGPGCHILDETVPGISRRNKLLGGSPLRVGNVVQVNKNVCSKCFWYHWAKNARGASAWQKQW